MSEKRKIMMMMLVHPGMHWDEVGAHLYPPPGYEFPLTRSKSHFYRGVLTGDWDKTLEVRFKVEKIERAE